MGKKAAASEEKNGVIYARYSSHAQKDASIEQQVRECLAFAKAQGIHITETYEDRAISGKTDRRPNFQRMMKDAEKGKFRYVVAWKSNRMGRNMLQAMMNESRLSELGVRVLYTEEDFDNTAAGRFALRSMMNVNQFYSENMAEDIKRGMYDNAMQCKVTNGRLPYGYKAGTDLQYEIDPPKDDIVREIFSRVACGESFVDIYTDLNNRKIKTGTGKKWGPNSFQRILTNERYTGTYIYGDIRIEGGIPQIIDTGLYLRVQEVLKMKKNPQGRHRINGEYLLTGKLFCGLCKSPMIGISGTSRNGALYHYYTCQKRRERNSCRQANVRRDSIENTVAKAIHTYILRDDVVEWLADSAINFARSYREKTCVGTLEQQLAETKRATKNLLAAIERGIITDSTKERLLELEREQSKIAMRLSNEQAYLLHYNRDDILSAISLYRKGIITDKKFQAKLFDAFLIAVYVYENRLMIEFNVGKKQAIDVHLDPDSLTSEILESESICSYEISAAPPYVSQTNTAKIYFFAGAFVLVCPKRTKE